MAPTDVEVAQEASEPVRELLLTGNEQPDSGPGPSSGRWALARYAGVAAAFLLAGAALTLAAAALSAAPVARTHRSAAAAVGAVSFSSSEVSQERAEALDIAEPDRDLLSMVVTDGKQRDLTATTAAPAKAGKCTKTSKSDASPSLFCWSLMTLGGTEEGLLKGIFKGRAGIFACNDYAVIARKRALIGEDECGEPYYTWQVDMPKTLPRGHYGVDAETNSFLNVKEFVDCWKALIDSGKVWENDFSVKVDSDAVFFPSRLSAQVEPHKGKAVFFTNCRYWGGDQVGKLFGALEVFSKQALGVYHNKNGTCMGLPWQRWGEDMFMERCMNAIGVPAVGDFKLTVDMTCPIGGNPDCGQQDIVAFHPHKDGGDWWNCWKKSTGV